MKRLFSNREVQLVDKTDLRYQYKTLVTIQFKRLAEIVDCWTGFCRSKERSREVHLLHAENKKPGFLGSNGDLRFKSGFKLEDYFGPGVYFCTTEPIHDNELTEQARWLVGILSIRKFLLWCCNAS